MTTPHTASMSWDRKRAGWYEAQAEDGSGWRIVQVTSQRWEVYRDGTQVADWPTTLTDAKWVAEREQQHATIRLTTPRTASTDAHVELLKAIKDALNAGDSLDLVGRASTVQSVIKLVLDESGHTPPEWGADFLRGEIERWQRKLTESRDEAVRP
jgi:hypothetical protein